MTPIRPLLRTLAGTVVELFYPTNCVVCGVPQEPGKQLCDRCKADLRPILAPFCRTCSRPFEGKIRSPFQCVSCEDRDMGFDLAVSAYRATGLLRDLIHRFKYSGHYYLRHALAEFLLEAFKDERLQKPVVEAIVPVPLHSTRHRDRGYNQSEALAEIVSRRLQIPVLNCLRRRVPTRTQTQFDREERMQNLRKAFVLRESNRVHGKNLLLLDDILTTGSTLAECAKVLRAAGAQSVRAITVARG
jgi:competence protein ComFC